MPDQIIFLAVALGIALAALAGYYLWLRARIAQTRAELEELEQQSSSHAAS